MKEAEDDFKRGNYDKAISASYFAVRMLAEIFLKDLNRKDDKIANALGRALNESVRISCTSSRKGKRQITEIRYSGWMRQRIS
ncbi:MAG: hypothetical protein ACP5JF_08410 [Candidatus Methanodesulfokora sp.]